MDPWKECRCASLALAGLSAFSNDDLWNHLPTMDPKAWSGICVANLELHLAASNGKSPMMSQDELEVFFCWYAGTLRLGIFAIEIELQWVKGANSNVPAVLS